MSNILTKIRIDHVKGAHIASFTDFDIFHDLHLKENKQFDNWEINIGDKIKINNEEYIIDSVFFIVHSQVFDNTGHKGISTVVTGERHEFNFEIVYYVR